MTTRYRRDRLSDRPLYSYEFYATGRGTFPFDMLRHDCCWPADSESAYLIVGDRGPNRNDYSVLIRSYREPTIDRWSSFGWSIGTVKLS
jgi:hypothetical protein